MKVTSTKGTLVSKMVYQKNKWVINKKGLGKSKF